jgi:HD-GYP domain-containing protein (c-di-GMP phosphodiesterase class II)
LLKTIRISDSCASSCREGRNNHFDPKVLDAFRPLAEGVYRTVAGREDERLGSGLEEVTRHYFSSGLDTLEF